MARSTGMWAIPAVRSIQPNSASRPRSSFFILASSPAGRPGSLAMEFAGIAGESRRQPAIRAVSLRGKVGHHDRQDASSDEDGHADQRDGKDDQAPHAQAVGFVACGRLGQRPALGRDRHPCLSGSRVLERFDQVRVVKRHQREGA